MINDISKVEDPRKTFVLGVGCQKGGTTWLQNYLKALPECNFGFEKEYHVLDVHFFPYLNRFRDRRIKKAKRAIRNEHYPEHPKIVNNFQMVNFYRNIKNYFDYFSILADRDPSTKVVGDITPSYALLPKVAFELVKNEMELRGFDVKVIFLMRDPAERLFSAVRMELRDSQPGSKVFDKSLDDLTLEMLNNPLVKQRSEYKETILRLESVFPTDDIFYGIYEDLFSERQIRRLSDFLNIGYGDPQFSSKINITERKASLSDHTIKIVRSTFSPSYKFVADRFPDTDFKALWSN